MNLLSDLGLIKKSAKSRHSSESSAEEGNEASFSLGYETGFNNDSSGVFRRIFDALTGGEIFFFLFLVSGQFKALIPMPSVSFLDLTLIFMVLTLCCAVYRTIKSKKLLWAAGLRMLIPYLVILAAFTVSKEYDFSLSYNYGYVKYSDYIIKLGFTVAMPFFVLSSVKSLKRFFTCLVVYTAIMILETIIRYFINGVGRIGFVDVLGTSYMQASRYICAGFIIVFALIMARLRDSGKRFAFPYCIAALFAVLVGGARASGLTFYVILIFPLFLYIPYRGKRLWPGGWIRRYLAIFIMLSVASAVLLLTPLTNTFKYRMNILPTQSGEAMEGVALFEGSVGAEMGEKPEFFRNSSGRGYVPSDGPPSETPYEKQIAIKRELNLDYGIQNSYIHPEWAERPSILKYLGVYNEGYGVVEQVDNTERQFWNSSQNKKTKQQLQSEGKNPNALSRFELLFYSIQMIYKRPFIGWGPGAFPIYVFNVDARVYPHNMFLEVWAEGGIFALLGFLAMIVIAVWRVLRAWFVTRNKKDHWVYLALAMSLAYWLTMTFLTDFVNGCRILFVIMAVCMLVPYRTKEPALR